MLRFRATFLMLLLAPLASAGAEAPNPKCAGMSEGAECWIELADRPDCYVFNHYYDPTDTVTWFGECQDGLAVGPGTLGRESADGSDQATGTLVRGKRHGQWVLQNDDRVMGGSYVEGKRHGQWVIRATDGGVGGGPYVDGDQHGQWVIRAGDGSVGEGLYVDGKQHGHWVVRAADGSVHEGSYVDGERHGKWVVRHADGTTLYNQYDDGVLVDEALD